MTKISRIASSDFWRLPLALGVAGVVVSGTAAMAWPALKTALVPVPGPAVAPADPAAVSDFVATTRAQMTPALAEPAGIPEVTLAHAPNLMLDAAILRQPRMEEPPLAQSTLSPPAPLPAPQAAPEVQTAQAQTPRPLPRATPERAQAAPAPVAAQTQTPRASSRVVPVAAQPQVESPEARTRARLKNMWMSGAYR